MLVVWLGLLTGMPSRGIGATITLEEALKKKLVTATITGNSGYYGQSIKMKLRNLGTQSLSLNLEAGRRLNCVYDSVQDMMITKSEIMALLPSQTKEFTIFAMCCEKNNRTPATSSSYNYGAMASTHLVKLAVLIEQLSAQSLTGQKAVWVLTDGISPEEITGEDAKVVKALKEYVINVVNYKKSAEREPGFIYDYSYPKLEGEMFTIEGDFDWEMNSPGYVSLYIYDNNGKQILVLFQDRSAGSGLQRYHYKITDAAFEAGELYWIRMKQSGRTIKELAIQMD